MESSPSTHMLYLTLKLSRAHFSINLVSSVFIKEVVISPEFLQHGYTVLIKVLVIKLGF